MKAYSEYKTSDSKLTHKIPKNWGEASLKRTVDGCVNGIWGSEPDGKDDIACIRVADFDRTSNSISTEKLTLRAVSYSERANRLVRNGDLLIEKSGGGDKTLVGAVAIYQHAFEAVTSNFVAKMRPRAGYSSTFLNYCFAALYSSNVNYCSIKQTTGIQNLDSEAYLQEKVGVPSYHEQQKIAHFLDYETAKIDALIDEQKRLIELLKEKRQAVISHAVTKGLNPDAPMKDSGVEWLGEVPEHWRVCRAKNVSYIFVPQRNKPDLNELEGTMWVTMEDMKKPLISESKHFVSREAQSKAGSKTLPANSVIASCVGNFGISAICEYEAIINQQLQAFIPDKVAAQYLAELVRISKPYFELIGTAATLTYVNQAGFENMPVTVPPTSEQQEIINYCKINSEQFDSLIGSARHNTSLLKERRSALISAAVTGKIDVRDWQPPAGSDTVDSNASVQTERHYG